MAEPLRMEFVVPDGVSDEIKAMVVIEQLMDFNERVGPFTLDDDARRRICQWADERWGTG